MQELTFMAPVQAWLAVAWGAFHRPEQNLRGQQDLRFGCKGRWGGDHKWLKYAL